MESHIELLPNTPEYKDFLYNALIKRDVAALKSIKKNFGQPIHLVKNWFHYSLMMRDDDRRFIVIFDNDAMKQYERFLDSQKEAV